MMSTRSPKQKNMFWYRFFNQTLRLLHLCLVTITPNACISVVYAWVVLASVLLPSPFFTMKGSGALKRTFSLSSRRS